MTNKYRGAARLFYLLGFERLIAPVLIKLIYWVGLALILIAGATGFVNASGEGIGRMLLTLFALLLSLLIWRLVSELWILAFNIYERLVEIRDLMARQTQTPAVIQPALRDGD
ncbi:DUF4282 domain-containing protein [Collimonas humicola]|uniref:DUF4282 domain-containing protein n=1 Tax=Collimonas humicola TaxID=2825886 RepID=UPI001B8ADB36|nr:DUF4282 domain-containing protein [Collimonas humicola]